jgi:gliding motility-associated-like protein
MAANAKHIVGGGFDIVWLHDSTYELHLRMLRDCSSNVDFDAQISVGTFDLVTNTRIQIISMSLGTTETQNFISAKCSKTIDPSTYCLDIGYYTKVITLPPRIYNNNAGYYFSWERCCRNNIIQNIVNPGTSGMTFYMQIPPPKLLKNSTPRWNNNPHTLLCKDNPFTYNFNFLDVDGDSLVYSLVNPLQGNLNNGNPSNGGNPQSGSYQPVSWMSGFDNTKQITGAPALSINSSTGQITVNPNVTGVFVSAIRVEEYRNGKKLGEVRLELEYIVIDCISDPPPVISLTDANSVPLNGKDFTVQIPNKLCFNIVTTSLYDSLKVKIEGNILDSNFLHKPVVLQVDSGNLKTTTQFCWQTACDLTGLAPQTIKVSVTDNGCPLPKTTSRIFTITILPMPLINPTRILCMTLVDNKETIIYWGDSTGKNKYFYKYNLYRGTDSIHFNIIDTLLDKNITNFNDKNTPNYALTNYQYYMRGVNLCGFEGPSSDTLGTFDQIKSLPDPQKLTTVTVDNNKQIKVVWAATHEKDFAQYYLYKTLRNDTSFKLLKNFIDKNDTVYFDENVDVQKISYCYYLVMKDTCGNYGPNGKSSCSIVLKGNSTPFENTLSWLPYNYWDNGTQCYIVFREDTEIPYSKNNSINPSETIYNDAHLDYQSGQYHYYVEANQNPITDQIPPIIISRSNEIELIQTPLLYVPDALTPNSDGINDDWGIHNVFVKDYHLQIYNWWGQLVFETHDKNLQWKGESLNGNIQQTDVYVYLISYSGWDNSYHTLKGNVTLLR